MRCVVDGVLVAQSRSGRWIHVDSIPEGFDEHGVTAVVEDFDYEVAQVQQQALRLAASDMLAHHGTLHPSADCEWASNLRKALRTTRAA